MKTISFGNKEYVKASAVAKKFRYTQDYVGQLCRGDKVDACLVGRVWYIHMDSVTEYRKTKHATQKKASNKNQITVKKAPRSKVEPVIRAKTARTIKGISLTTPSPNTNSVRTSYSRDAVSIIPVLHAKEGDSNSDTKSAVQTEPKPARKITIKVRPNTKKATEYYTKKIPDITLKSTLKVTTSTEATLAKSISDSAEETNVEPEKDTPYTDHGSIVVRKQESSEPDVDTGTTTPSHAPEPELAATHRPYAKVAFLTVVVVSAITSFFFIFGLSSYTETALDSSQSGTNFTWSNLEQTLSKVLP